MFRPAMRFSVIALALGVALPVAAQEPTRDLVAPSPAVAAAWVREASERQALKTKSASDGLGRTLDAPSPAVAGPWATETNEGQAYSRSSKSLKALYASYGVLQGLDMYSTIAARRNGARELNPIMSGSYAQATLVKGLVSAGTMAAVKRIEKTNKKAATFTMVAINVVTAAVVVNNFRNARRLR